LKKRKGVGAAKAAFSSPFVGALFIYRRRRLVFKRGMPAFEIIIVKEGEQPSSQFFKVVVFSLEHVFPFDGAPEPFDEDVSKARPRPSRLTRMPRLSDIPSQGALVN
jgi:hypothetical protein